MSTEPESFLARWSRRKRAAEAEAERPADSATPQLPTPEVDSSAAAASDATVAAPAPARHAEPATEIPLPPIESLDGLRSDYQAFFQQPVEEELRHAALKKLFADPHFNKMDMLDVYVDDYTQFEPLSAELRMRLPSARSFLLDSERAALDAVEASTGAAGDVAGTAADAVGQHTEAATSQALGEQHELAGIDAASDSSSGPGAIASAAHPHAPSPDAPPRNPTANDPSSS